MHAYVLTSFVVNCICLAVILMVASFNQTMSGSTAVACATGVLMKAGLPMVMTDQNRKAHSPRTHAHRVSLYKKTGGAS